MRKVRLRPSTSLIEAEWLALRLRSFVSGVAALVPDEFQNKFDIGCYQRHVPSKLNSNKCRSPSIIRFDGI
jgi:hypothetical protein